MKRSRGLVHNESADWKRTVVMIAWLVGRNESVCWKRIVGEVASVEGCGSEKCFDINIVEV
jgi:hypothetical protein